MSKAPDDTRSSPRLWLSNLAKGFFLVPRDVKVLSWVSFFADVSSEMVYPVIPLFIVGVLKAPAVALGISEGLAEAIVSFVKGWSGWHSDKKGRRMPYVRWGYGLSALGKVLIAPATHWPLVTAGRGVDRFGKGIRGSARDALIADATTKETAGRAFGFHRMLDTAGALVGVLIGVAMLRFMPNRMRLMFVLAAVPGFAAVLVTFGVKEKARMKSEDQSLQQVKFRPDSAYIRALLVMTAFALANSSDTFILLRLHDSGYSYVAVSLAYALETFVYALISYPFGVLSDRIGRMPLLVGGWTLYALVYLGLALAGGIAFWPLLALYGVFLAANDGVGKALIADVAPKASRGTAMGLFYMVTGFATLLSSVVAGELWDHVSHAAPFLFGSAMAAIAVLLVPLARKRADGHQTG